VKKGKPKKTIKINGLDLLHNETLLSTSPQGIYFLEKRVVHVFIMFLVLQL
jgi:hypothetical protein